MRVPVLACAALGAFASVKLAPLLADLKVEPCFARPRTDNDNGSKPRRCDGTAKFRRIPIDAHAHIGVEG